MLLYYARSSDYILLDDGSFTNSVCFVFVNLVRYFYFFISKLADMINITAFSCKGLCYSIY